MTYQPYHIYNEDCMEAMRAMPDESVDMILCDLPFGVTSCAWDTPLPLPELFEAYRRLIVPKGAIVLFGSGKFTFDLVTAAYDIFRYQWIWEKDRTSNFINAKRRPLPSFESVLVFSKSPAANVPEPMHYFPQGLVPCCKKRKQSGAKFKTVAGARPCNAKYANHVQTFTNYPRDVLRFPPPSKKLHTSQKPVALCEYLIKTYTERGGLVLDNCMGSGTTAVACLHTGRRYLGFEKDAAIYETALRRIAENVLTMHEI